MGQKKTANIVNLAWVSFFNDLGSEVIARLVPLYLASVLGAPARAIGAIEGAAEAVSTLLKPVFGRLSDRLGRRKPFIVLGYLLSSVARPLLGIAGSWSWVGVFRVGDRLGKSLRNAPRDALIADSTLAHGHGFGLNRALDTAGALLGILLCIGLIHFRPTSAILSPHGWLELNLLYGIAGVFAVALLIFGVTEISAASKVKAHVKTPLPRALKRYLLWVGIFSIANSSDAFIFLRARELGYSLLGILGLIALFNLVSAVTSLPAALLSERLGRRPLLAAGWVIYAVSYFFFGSSWIQNPFLFALIASVYGLFYGFTDSVERAYIGDLAPADARGRAYGIFGFVVGMVAFPASFFFGWIWDQSGSATAFEIGAVISLVAATLLMLDYIRIVDVA